MDNVFSGLLVVEIAITAVAVAMFLWRSLLGMKEEDRLVLDEAEAHLSRGQDVIRQRVDILSKYIKVAGLTWSLLAVVILGLWVVQGLSLI